MMNKKKLNAFFDSKHSDEEYLEMYEKYKLDFNKLIRTGHIEDVEFGIRRKIYSYIQSLNSTGNYTAALQNAIQAEKELEKLKGKSDWYEMFVEGCKFQKALSLGRLKKYRQSNFEFKKLIEKNPTQENFKSWYESNRVNLISSVFNKITIISIGIYLLIFFAEILGFKTIAS